MINLGKIHELTVWEQTNKGYYLVADDCEDKIFIPNSQISKETKLNEKITAFVFLDSTDTPTATTSIPHGCVGEFAFMQCINTINAGAFFDWGISKDLFVPDTEQREYINLHEWHLLRVCKDERTEKIYGTTRINKYIQNSEFDIDEGDSVNIVPVSEEELGYRCIINKKFIGMIYYNEVFSDIDQGVEIKGVVKKIREDGLVDAALQVQGFKNVRNSKETILEYLESIGGKSPLHDKSTPFDIQEALGMSKQTFKKAIGMLFKDRKIFISKTGIELVKKN